MMGFNNKKTPHFEGFFYYLLYKSNFNKNIWFAKCNYLLINVLTSYK